VEEPEYEEETEHEENAAEDRHDLTQEIPSREETKDRSETVCSKGKSCPATMEKTPWRAATMHHLAMAGSTGRNYQEMIEKTEPRSYRAKLV